MITLKANKTAKAERKTLDDIEHLVLPVIAAKEGVMNGLFYPENELRGFVEAWNGVPVPIYHPSVNGINVSANSPDIEEKWNVGKFFNVHWDNAIKGEVWINIEKAEKIGHKEVIERLENGEMMELSTGLLCETNQSMGEFKGNKYRGIVKNIRPDHLALLPNQEGACSIKDGCGALRVNKKSKELFEDNFGLVLNELSSENIRMQLEMAIGDNGWVRDVFDGFFIHSVSNKFFMRNFTIENDLVEIGEEKQEVIPKTTYMTVEGMKINNLIRSDVQSIELSKEKFNSEKEAIGWAKKHNFKTNRMTESGGGCFCLEQSQKNENDCLCKVKLQDGVNAVIKQKEGGTIVNDKEKLVNSLISNSKNKFTEEDKEGLLALSINTLNAFNEDESENKEPEQEKEEKSADDVIDNIKNPEIKSVLSNALNAQREKKDGLVKSLVDNSKFSKEELEAMEINVLEKLSASIKPEANFLGNAGSTIESNSNDIPAPPKVILANLDKKEEGK